jgi:hypothetical protein
VTDRGCWKQVNGIVWARAAIRDISVWSMGINVLGFDRRVTQTFLVCQRGIAAKLGHWRLRRPDRPRKTMACPTVWLAISLFFFCWPLAAERRIALIVDTSGSMKQNDPPRYAAQISKILSDLAEDRDRVAIIRFPPLGIMDRLFPDAPQNCNSPADSSLMVELNGAQRSQFKSQIDQLLQYSGPTYFGPPLRDAIPFLGEDRGVQRLLLLISDAQEGFGDCDKLYTQMLQRFESTGATVALIKMGGHEDDFKGNPAIQFREDVLDSRKLIGAVAHIYQRFLGSLKVQTGNVSGDIAVDISPHVKEAFVVVAADSPLGQLNQRSGNPQADKIDLDYRGGGLTAGMDRRERGYRIIRLTNPSAGRYTFSAPRGTTGGWMLIEDYALALRLVSQTPVPSDTPSTVQIEIVDERTGKRVTDVPTLNNIRITGRIDSSTIPVTNEGPGLFRFEHKFGSPGKTPLQAKLTGENIDRTFDLPITVEKTLPPNIGKLEVQSPDHGEVGAPSTLKVRWTGTGTPPDRVVATIDGKPVELNEKGPDGSYSTSWAPDTAGTKKIRFEAEGSSTVPPVESEITIADKPAPPPPPPPPPLATPGELTLGHGLPVNIGRVPTGEQRASEVRIADGKVARDVEVEIATDFEKKHAHLEIETPGGWQTLTSSPLKTKLAATGGFHWPVRVRVEKCPEACKPGEGHKVTFVAHLTDGSVQKTESPLEIEIVPDPWYVCWRVELLSALGVLLAGFVAYGIISPYRFGRRVGVQMSPAEDLNEGFYFPLRAARGSRSGFYRDARLFMTEDFRLQGRKSGGFVRLRAAGSTVRVRPENGRSVWRQQADGTWELLNPHQEMIARQGTVFRNDQKTIFFDVRTK